MIIGIEIGKQGAELGGKGAILGFKVVAGVLKMLASKDVDSFKMMIDNETESIEAEANVLEEIAGNIDQKAEEIKKYTITINSDIDQLKNKIIELSNVKWFKF